MSGRTMPAVVVHGGAGASIDDVDGCEHAARAGMSALLKGGGALAAVVDAVVVLEDDGRFNAGSGAVLGLDGETIEMDASAMDTLGRLGAVACIRRVRNPVLVARAVADSPHRLLCGEGAERFARVLGMEPYVAANEKVNALHREVMARLRTGHDLDGEPASDDIARLWNYAAANPMQPSGGDTVGAVARDADGQFAVAGSTGGTSPALLGRVGDTPLMGAGFYAGPVGAIAVTGIGEAIIPHLLAYRVYQWLSDGIPLDQALQRAVALFPNDVDIGLIAVSRTEAGHCSNRHMPTFSLTHENTY